MKVIVVMSTYNGENNIERQLVSILNQRNVDIKIFIRDDGSTDNTKKVIKNFIKKNSLDCIELLEGYNEGWAKSFWDALCLCGEADYYAFSDQDDVWYEDKIIKCIKAMEADDGYHGAKMAYCKMRRTDSNLVPYIEQHVFTKPEQITKKIALTKIFAAGAAMCMNAKARELVCRVYPTTDKDRVGSWGHDAWTSIIATWFGKVYFVNEELYDWIRYETSVTGSGSKRAGYIFILKSFFKGTTYQNPALELLTYYNDLLNEKEKRFLGRIVRYKSSVLDKMALFFDTTFVRDSIKGTIILKLSILRGIY